MKMASTLREQIMKAILTGLYGHGVITKKDLPSKVVLTQEKAPG